MRDDLTASEKRLIAALDRIDHFIDRATGARAIAPAPVAAGGGLAEIEARLHAAQGENRRLSGELVLLHERQAALLANCETRLTEAHERLSGAGLEAARLAAANEVLAEANRALIAASGAPADEARLALEAEIESLRAVRAAETAQMGDLLAVLDRMIDTPAPETAEAPRAPVRAAAAAPAVAPAVAPVLEMPMPEQVTEFAGASHDAASADAGDASGPAEERG
ncbi:hypothetical protein [Paracoccus lutimaris]|uniref:Uncharacterized protein n=1 Tax=Paracoccus lutimaris TaxID=1490030 RepID=A0A368ZAB1_9RHOB|nr:hypothetical protein [Paracoccus lutimaris]RCW88979.1 hypothetical protein DFP89_101418 [Paracoccus lutimaris]